MNETSMDKFDKEIIRKEYLSKRNLLKAEVVSKNSEMIINKIFDSKGYKKAKNIFSYISFNNEVDTTKILNSGKRIYVPLIKDKDILITKYDKENLVENKYGILEPSIIKPIEISEIDLIIVPGIAFDINKNRLGFGGGFYDKILKNTKAIKIAPAHDFQILNSIPTEIHDIKMDIIITEKRIIK